MTITINHFKTRVVRYPLVAASALGAIVATGICHDFNKSEWAYWIAAIGTVAAFAGTIWLANAESRRRRRAELVRANIIAAGLAPKLRQLIDDLVNFQGRLWFKNEDFGEYRTPYEETIEFLRIEDFTVSTEDLVALDGLGEGVATGLSHAVALLDIARKIIRAHAESVLHSEKPLTEKTADSWEIRIADIRNRLESVARECEFAAKRHAAAPSEDDLYGPD